MAGVPDPHSLRTVSASGLGFGQARLNPTASNSACAAGVNR
jgi:hypothetical protein